jgi:hypothetical protein
MVVVHVLPWEHVCLRSRYSVTASVYFLLRGRCLALCVVYSYYLSKESAAILREGPDILDTQCYLHAAELRGFPFMRQKGSLPSPQQPFKSTLYPAILSSLIKT